MRKNLFLGLLALVLAVAALDPASVALAAPAADDRGSINPAPLQEQCAWNDLACHARNAAAALKAYIAECDRIAAEKDAAEKARMQQAVNTAWAITPQATSTLSAGVTPGAPPASGSSAGQSGTYTIVAGDTLGTVAPRFGTTLAELLAVNPSITNADRIYPGQVINLPGASATSGGTSPTQVSSTAVPTATPVPTLNLGFSNPDVCPGGETPVPSWVDPTPGGPSLNAGGCIYATPLPLPQATPMPTPLPIPVQSGSNPEVFDETVRLFGPSGQLFYLGEPDYILSGGLIHDAINNAKELATKSQSQKGEFTCTRVALPFRDWQKLPWGWNPIGWNGRYLTENHIQWYTDRVVVTQARIPVTIATL